MTGLNHAVTGALVAVALKRPEFALPAAFGSHFVLDVIPHWDYKIPGGEYMKQIAMMMDLSFTLAVLLVLSVTVHGSPRIVIAGGLLGVLPDFLWLVRDYVPRTQNFYRITVVKKILNWHHKIQWSETGWGLYVEIIWLVITLTLIYRIK